MILDAQLQFCDSQAVTADAPSTNVIDLTNARRMFKGEPLAILLLVEVAADGTTGDETYEVEVQTDDNSAFSSATEVVAMAIPRARLTAGSKHLIHVPPYVALERYIRLNFDVGGTTPSITVSAFLQPLNMIDSYEAYPDNSPIAG
jgi:hypothetical protein